jgi:hypothetical protein
LGNSMVYIAHLLGFARVEENALSERGFFWHLRER